MTAGDKDQSSSADLPAPKNRRRLHFRVTLLVAISVVIIAGLAVGGYLWWTHIHHHNQPEAANTNGSNTQNLPVVSSAETRQDFVKTVKDLKVPAGESKVGVLQIQMSVMFEEGEYKDSIAYAKELIAIPGYEDNTEAWQYIARSYLALGDKASERQADQKIVTYYDAHPSEKAGTVGKNLYTAAQARLKK